MRRPLFLVVLFLAGANGMLCGQTGNQTDDRSDVPLIDRAHAQDWSADINSGWRMHDGDDPSWASPGFDDSAWKTVQLDDLGPSRPGWRWFRLHLKLKENHPDISLLIDGGEGTYSLYVNGAGAHGAVKPWRRQIKGASYLTRRTGYRPRARFAHPRDAGVCQLAWATVNERVPRNAKCN
jgi:hypothetical protein